MNNVYLLLGSNMGDSEQMLSTCRNFIEKKIGNIETASSIYRTAAWGKEDQSDFLNQIIVTNTKLPAEKILEKIFLIEKEMGRIRTFKNAARVIDIDILFYNDEVIKTETLQVPHPQIQNRRFVLVPLLEIAPQFFHPSLKKSISELLHTCADTLNVQKI